MVIQNKSALLRYVLAQGLLIVAKAIGFISIPWIWVFSFTWLPFTLVFGVLFLVLLFIALSDGELIVHRSKDVDKPTV